MRDKDLVRELLKQRKWTYRRLAAEMELPESTVKGYINRGDYGMRCATFVKITKAMGYEVFVRDSYNKRAAEWRLNEKTAEEEKDEMFDPRTRVRNRSRLKAYEPAYFEVMLNNEASAVERMGVPEMFRKMDIKDDWVDLFEKAIEDLRNGGYIKGKAQRSNPFYWEQQLKDLDAKFPG